MRRAAATVRAIVVTAGRPVLQRAFAFWAGIGLLATVLFAGNGLQAQTLTRLFHGSVGARLALGAAWIALATPVVSCAFDAPGTRSLRALPLRRGALVCALLALLMLVQVPCGMVFARGDGLMAGAVMMLLPTSIEVALVAAVRSPRFALVAAAGTGLVLADQRPLFAALPAAWLASVAVAGAWRVALDGAALADLRMTLPTVPLLAIAAAHLLRMLRVARARLVAATVSVSFGAAVLGVSLHNDPPARPVGRALTVLSLPLAVCAAILVVPVRETEDCLRALARVTRTHWTTLLAAFALALAAPSSALAATAGVVAGTLAHVPALPLGAGAGAWAIPVACAVAAWARWHDRRTRRNPTLFVVGVLVVGAVATGVAGLW